MYPDMSESLASENKPPLKRLRSFIRAWEKPPVFMVSHSLWQGRCGMFRVTPQAFQKVGEAVLFDQFHVLGKHGEQAAHQKPGHGFILVALGAQRDPQLGKVVGNVACDLGRYQGRVQRHGVFPDRFQAVPDFFVVKVINPDTIAVLVRELGVALALTREAGIDFDHMSDIHHQQKRRPAVFTGHRTGVVVGLVGALSMVSSHRLVPRTP